MNSLFVTIYFAMINFLVTIYFSVISILNIYFATISFLLTMYFAIISFFVTIYLAVITLPVTIFLQKLPALLTIYFTTISFFVNSACFKHYNYITFNKQQSLRILWHYRNELLKNWRAPGRILLLSVAGYLSVLEHSWNWIRSKILRTVWKLFGLLCT
jgi:hypothetical protein